jgi:hypothetical protein
MNKSLYYFISLVSFICYLKTNVYSQSYVLIGWNDLGMHGSARDFSKIAILPPSNNIYAQLIKRVPGGKPQIIKSGIIIYYSFPGNTYSVGKTNFWTYAQQLFNLDHPLADNLSLTGKGLSGILDPQGNYFLAKGVPITPFPDSSFNKEVPFQLIHLVAKDSSTGKVLVETDVEISVGYTLSCVQKGCHASEQSILDNHPVTPLVNKLSSPNLCANCHQDNLVGISVDPVITPFSEAIHNRHANLEISGSGEICYKCHPGYKTRFWHGAGNSKIMGEMSCEDCHGTQEMMAHSISHGRQPWLDEPKCGREECHESHFSEEPGKLYSESRGHGGIFCSACHSNPHTELPSYSENGNFQNIQLLDYKGTIRNCAICHEDNPQGNGPHSFIRPEILVDNSAGRKSGIIQNNQFLLNPLGTLKNNPDYDDQVKLSIYNSLGEIIRVIEKGLKPAGYYQYVFNKMNLSSGIYFYSLDAKSSDGRNTYRSVKKFILLK